MTKKTGYLIFFVFILVTGTEYLNSMEEETKNTKLTEKGSKLAKILQTIAPSLPVEALNAINKYKCFMEDSETERKAQLSMFVDTPCGAGLSIQIFQDKDTEETERLLFFSHFVERGLHEPPSE